MPFGNFQHNIIDNGQMNERDLEYFVTRLLIDLKNSSSNPLLSGVNSCKVDLHKILNLHELDIAQQTKVLIGVNFNPDSPANVDFSKIASTGLNNWHASMLIYIYMKNDLTTADKIRDIADIIEDGITSNKNDLTTYKCGVPSGNIYGSDLWLNEAGSKFFPEQYEDLNQPNYYTVVMEVLFKIYRLN